jgi:hypothetical protein
MTVVRYDTHYALWNSALELTYGVKDYFRIRRKGTVRPEGWNPFNVGFTDTLHDRLDVLRTKYSGGGRYRGETQLNGEQYHLLELWFPFGKNKNQIDLYWIDPRHGYLPARIETYYDSTDKLAMLTVVKSFREIPPGRWITELARYFNLQSMRCREFQLVDVEVDDSDRPEVFQIAVPPMQFAISEITKQEFHCRSGRVGLRHFNNDGSLAQGQTDVVPWSPSETHEAATLPDATGPSTVPPWPFALGASGTKKWLWGLLASCAALAGMGLVLAARKWLRSR